MPTTSRRILKELTAIRKAKGLSGPKVSALMNRSRFYITVIEGKNRRFDPSIKVLELYAKALGRKLVFTLEFDEN